MRNSVENRQSWQTENEVSKGKGQNKNMPAEKKDLQSKINNISRIFWKLL